MSGHGSCKSFFVSLVTLVFGVTLLTMFYYSGEDELTYVPLRRCNGLRISLDPSKACAWKCKQPFAKLEELPSNATDSLRYFVLFVGHARSGSSITGAVLDAHPHVILSHEYFLARRMALTPKMFENKSSLLSQLYTNQKRKIEAEKRGKGEQKGYSIFVNDSFTGKYDKSLGVVGDKSAAMTLLVYMSDRERFAEVVHNIETLAGVPVKFIQVGTYNDTCTAVA